jgi:hypothetical protein
METTKKTENAEQLDKTINVLIDFDTHAELMSDLNKKRKLGTIKDVNNKRIYGVMIEERFKLDKALKRKKMTFAELLSFLNKV